MLKLQSAHVCLTMSANQTCTAQLQKIEDVDGVLRKLSDFEGLLIADIGRGESQVVREVNAVYMLYIYQDTLIPSLQRMRLSFLTRKIEKNLESRSTTMSLRLSPRYYVNCQP